MTTLFGGFKDNLFIFVVFGILSLIVELSRARPVLVLACIERAWLYFVRDI